MQPHEYQRVIDELQAVIDEARATMTRAEDAGVDETMPEDYAALHDIYRRSVEMQRQYTLMMLAAESGGR